MRSIESLDWWVLLSGLCSRSSSFGFNKNNYFSEYGFDDVESILAVTPEIAKEVFHNKEDLGPFAKFMRKVKQHNEVRIQMSLTICCLIRALIWNYVDTAEFIRKNLKFGLTHCLFAVLVSSSL